MRFFEAWIPSLIAVFLIVAWGVVLIILEERDARRRRRSRDS